MPRARSRYSSFLGRRYILIRPQTLLPAALVDVMGYSARRVIRRLGRKQEHGPVRRILAIRLDHIGDVLITMPALRHLRQQLPEARLDVLAGSWSADLLRDDPDVDRVIAFDAPWYGGVERLSALPRLVRMLRRERYDLVVDFRGDLRHLALARLIGAKRVYGYGIRGGGFLSSEEVPHDERAHEVDKALALARAAAPPAPASEDKGLDFRIPLKPDDEAEALRLIAQAGVEGDRLLVALCPASRNPTRRWVGERFAEVARHLVERYGAQVLVCGDAVSADIEAALLRPEPPGVRSLVGRTSLGVFAAVLARADLIISVESSPIHFASALRKPIVTVFGGSSLPGQWGPYGTGHRIVVRQVECSPCHLLRCPLPRVLCMEAIAAEDVSRACDDLLAEVAAKDSAVAARLQRASA